jgi:long-chain fatty acid transport protein
MRTLMNRGSKANNNSKEGKTMDRRKKLGAWGIWGFLFFTFIALAPGDAEAVTIWPGASYFDFSFNNPGARAGGMGGAFIGVADDATAAYTNPAGLTVLTRPEVAGEYKYSNREVVVRSANIAGSNAKETTFDDNVARGCSFLSFSYPFQRGNITAFRHELVNSDIQVQAPYYLSNIQTNLRTQTYVTTYGVAVAYKLFDTLSIGGNIGFSELDFRNNLDIPSSSDRYTWDASGWAENYAVGLFWNPFGSLNIGAVYRYGPKFRYTNQTFYNNTIDPANNAIIQFDDEYKIPDVYGIGISYRFPFGLTIASDYDYIRYSQIDKLYDPFRGDDLTTSNPSRSLNLHLDDAYEIHAGLEWAFTVKDIPLAVRTGYTFKQAHGIYTEYSNPAIGPTPGVNYVYQKGDDENIFSAGFGIVLFKNLQLDFSGAWGNLSTEYIGSAVIRF